MLQAMKIGDAKGEETRNDSSLAVGQSKEQELGYSGQHNKTKKKVHFGTLMDTCHLKNVESEPKFQKYDGRAVLQGDTVKDDSGSCAAFTEKGSSA